MSPDPGTGSAPDAVVEAVTRADLDELLRVVDALCSTRDWAALVALRDLCRAAQASGRQLWPAAAHTEYRLALEAPAPYAAAVLIEGAGRFAPGPLPEVAASTHTWSDLAPHAPFGPAALLTMHERVVRGEDLSTAELAGPPVLELPLRLEPWEPAYGARRIPRAPGRVPVAAAPAAAHDRRGRRGAAVWTAATRCTARTPCASSSPRGRACPRVRADAVAVAGDAPGAITALGPRRVRMAVIEPAAAIASMAWAGASGGAHGRRPGAAAGRFGAWWAAAALTGLLDDWPVEPARLGDAVAGLRWYAWDAAEPATGWRLQLAVEDPARGLAWALVAARRALSSRGPV